MRIITGALVMSLIAVGTAQALDKVQIGDKNVFPESLTSTADGTLIAGSVGTGEIFRAAPGAAHADKWIGAAADGPTSVLGVFADEANKTLWACYSDLALFAGKPGKASVLRGYDLSSGAQKVAVPLGDGTFCNDIATTADGTAYITETAGGQVFRLKPGATAVEPFFKDAALASVDGLSLGPDGALYLNGVSTGKLFRLAINTDGTAGALTELKTSSPLKGPDGMRFGDDGVLYLAENGAAQVDAITIAGDAATVTPLKTGGWDTPTAVTKVGKTIWVGEAKFSKLGGAEDPGTFWAYPVALN